MVFWQATNAKAKFSGLLDATENEGPQIIRRRKRVFYLLTKEQLVEKSKTPLDDKPFASAWDALRPSAELCFDFDFPRAKGKARAVKF